MLVHHDLFRFILHVNSYEGSIKGLSLKKHLGRKQKQNRPIPPWIRMRTGSKIRYNAKRRHWRRTKLGM
ncbi:ribosomal protein RPL39 [Toxoplasma gondii TgCatPRC2]|uniref:Ribosomal protein RPL39 n=10 Tax=Toxoplasma gondii TaxID=5811 RepID=A0A125YT89_TOXGV|nr:ribosomal protein RPL39 [Toxoplasma gondii ME49]EPR59101.1 ribosomal protein RPL39 [Toxoplasma gondii GT1]ESS30454.1 ribosomal protein RPL39 [Toxoplasma gondii VEG]KFG35377.1 ribosomal protein RPL39 [Toxoplasma gondii GAB2-2007-GAL-DOM2]KFG53065.1 ribosomal protein RPL39 [Toxoplasma gondii FOU]KFG59912.1 ribosomal protein RPL39 [Toxoplasma gondii RUB]KFH06768.1 ribosomal protein RPL39 [Toxoplasma gondii VAND]KYF42025.1 ribosomal protein RPL39 [Toxoplasma gondii ARI]KYK67320.1 ribosomal p|eukprot:XP_018638122.1 ribosomal protein RPL39 [Toxoplasma gondii ME49]